MQKSKIKKVQKGNLGSRPTRGRSPRQRNGASLFKTMMMMRIIIIITTIMIIIIFFIIINIKIHHQHRNHHHNHCHNHHHYHHNHNFHHHQHHDLNLQDINQSCRRMLISIIKSLIKTITITCNMAEKAAGGESARASRLLIIIIIFIFTY